MSAVRTKVAWSQRVCTWACGQREGGAVSREGGGHVYSEVNQSALCLTHFLTPVTVSSRALPCHMLTNSALNTITATMGLCYSEKKRKFGVLKSWGEVSFCLSASFFFVLWSFDHNLALLCGLILKQPIHRSHILEIGCPFFV